MQTPSVIALVFWCAACGGSDPPANPDAPPAIDAAIDAVPLPANLIGVWVRIPTQVQDPPPPPAERDRLRLAADGTFIVEEMGDDDTGTWSADSATMTFVTKIPAGTTTITTGYHVAATKLVLPVLLPVGAVDGTVGTWRDVTIEDGKTTTTTLDLRADLTATLRSESDNPKLYQGTWAYDDDEVVFTTMVSETTTLHIHIQEIRGVALGTLHDRETTAQASSPRRPRSGVGEHVELGDLTAWLRARGD